MYCVLQTAYCKLVSQLLEFPSLYTVALCIGVYFNELFVFRQMLNLVQHTSYFGLLTSYFVVSGRLELPTSTLSV